MKKYLYVFLAIMALMVVMAPVAMAEAVDAAPVVTGKSPLEGIDLTQLISAEVLATMTGMILVAGVITQGVKMVFMRSAGTGAIRTMAFVVAVVVVVIAKIVLQSPFEIADIVVIPGNSFIVWFASMKAYEKTFGAADTPAGNAHTGNIQ